MPERSDPVEAHPKFVIHSLRMALRMGRRRKRIPIDILGQNNACETGQSECDLGGRFRGARQLDQARVRQRIGSDGTIRSDGNEHSRRRH